MADQFDKLREAVRAARTPIGNMDPEGRMKALTGRIAYQQEAINSCMALLDAYDELRARDVLASLHDDVVRAALAWGNTDEGDVVASLASELTLSNALVALEKAARGVNACDRCGGAGTAVSFGGGQQDPCPKCARGVSVPPASASGDG